jgi:hypothetical protein
MTVKQRPQQFEEAVKALPAVSPEAYKARGFGFSNSARIIEAGLFACTSNLETYSRKIASGLGEPFEQLVVFSVLNFPPQDEVYFAIIVNGDSARVNNGLIKLFKEGEERNKQAAGSGKTAGKINNNVKFYVTDQGQIFFHNYDFRLSLTDESEGEVIDPDCTANIDAIYFSIWPPAASAHRSLIAREFVGYLGSLIGRERVHEVRAWEDSQTVSPEMQRMPASIPIEEIERGISRLGGHYPHGEVKNYHAALNFLEDKHFSILSGLSGTGKTRLALSYAKAVHGIQDHDTEDPFLTVCPVRPEWTDPSGLMGYHDVLSDRYVVPPFLEAVFLATAHRYSPVFVVLDEMNLARVEYYLSDILSSMEAGEPLRLHSSSVPLEGSTGISVPASLPLPHNLFITGTVNVDETTHPVSDKVLDRAVIIDMTKIDLVGFIDKLAERFPDLKKACQACKAPLGEVYLALSGHGQGFGYRVAEEVIRYYDFHKDYLSGSGKAVKDTAAAPYDSGPLFEEKADAAIDDLMAQKVLVKLRGSERERKLLDQLRTILKGMNKSQSLLDRLLDDLDEFGSFQASR